MAGVATMGVMGDMSPTTLKMAEKVTHHFQSWSPTICKNLSPTDTHNLQDKMCHPSTPTIIGHFGHPHFFNPDKAPGE